MTVRRFTYSEMLKMFEMKTLDKPSTVESLKKLRLVETSEETMADCLGMKIARGHVRKFLSLLNSILCSNISK